MEIKKILVPVDGSAPSLRAFECAASIAEKCHASLFVLYAVSPDDVDDVEQSQYREAYGEICPTAGAAKDKADEEIASFLKEAPADVPIEKLVIMGYPEKAITHFAENNHFDLIVMGNSGKGTFSTFVTGSVSYYTIHHAKCPVLIVK